MLYYDFYISIDDDDHGWGDYDVELDVWEKNITFITQFLFEKHFGIPYRELGWWLEPGAKEFVKEIEEKWLHNKLDFSPYEEEYQDWVYKKCLPDALSELDRDHLLDLYCDYDDDDDDDDNDSDDDDDYDIFKYDITVFLDGEEVDWL